MEALYQIGKDISELRARLEKLEGRKCGCAHKTHPTSIRIKGMVNEGDLPEDYVVRMEVTFGPGFSSKPLTRGEFIAKLREQSKKQAKGFLRDMLQHYADHIEAAAGHFPDGKYALEQPAPIRIANAYYGCGSCDDCSYSHPGGDCAICVHDGIQSCEPCD
jgi:hypothetical protein